MSYTDFKDGLTSVDDYLSGRHHVNQALTAGSENSAKIVAKAELDFTMRELICNLLAGHGLKVPNLQVCIQVNLKALLKDPIVDLLGEDFKEALETLKNTMDKFLDHTNLENVLSRMNEVLSEATQVASMINFCATPIDPKAITNLLEQIMQSYLGAGEDLMNAIGQMLPDQVISCLNSDGTFNSNLFADGVLGEISQKWDRITSGEILDTEIESFNARLKQIDTDLRSLMQFENNISGAYAKGGSIGAQTDAGVNKRMGVLHNPDSISVAENARLAAMLKSFHDQLAGYPVIGNDGTQYDNIFELILEPDFIEKINKEQDPEPRVVEQGPPIRNYCGDIIGYEQVVVVEGQANLSEGNPLPETPPPSAGYRAGGLSTAPVDLLSQAPASAGGEPLIAGAGITGGSTGGITGGTVNPPTGGSTNTGTVITTGAETRDVLTGNTNLTMTTISGKLIKFTTLAKRIDGDGLVSIERTYLAERNSQGISLNEVGSAAITTTIGGFSPNAFLYAIGDEIRGRITGNDGQTIRWNVVVDVKSV